MRGFVKVDPRSVLTHKVNWVKAYKYAKLLEEGALFPPPKGAHNIHGQLVISNGAHRTIAHRLLGRQMKISVSL